MKTRVQAALTCEELMRRLRDMRPELRESYGVNALWLFGSYARGMPRRTSDVDVLVEYVCTLGLLKFIELQQLLSSRLGARVDLVRRAAVKAGIRDRILGEALQV